LDWPCEADFRRIGNDVFVADRIFAADVAVVCGITTWNRPVEQAIELYRSGAAKRLLFTGGYNRKIDAIEAVSMADAAAHAGIPASAILIEDQATNTSENLAFSRRLLETAGGLNTVASVLLVAIEYHMRRVLMTAERMLPARIALGTAAYPSVFYTSADWHGSERGRRDVASEIEKIRLYLDPAWPGAAP
jgi:uncharacterized SAM-binding protein YcdF (DUF218 family)